MFDLNLSETAARKYSVARAILSAADGTSSFESELSQEISKGIGRPPRNVGALFVPTQLRPQASGLDTRTNAAGGYLRDGTSIELELALRTQSRCVELGAEYLSGLRGNVQFAIESATTSASWIPENPMADIAETDQSFVARTATPHTLQSTSSFSKQLLSQSSIQVENFVRLDLMKSHALALDAAAISGPGSQGAPVGLLRQANLPTVAIGTDGGPVLYSHLCSLEETIALANVDSPSIAFLTSPTQRRKLRTTYKNGAGSEPVWDDDATGLLGYRSAVSNAVPSNLSKGSGTNLSAVICGNFSYMTLTEFGVVELVVDKFRLKKQGLVEITSFSLVDCVIRQLSAFAIIADAA